MPTIAQELQALDLKLDGFIYQDAPDLFKRRRQLYESVCAVKTWQDGNTNKRIITAGELPGLIGHAARWVFNELGAPDLFHEENLTLEWTGQREWPFVRVTLTNSQDKDDCFKYNSERMEAP